VQVGVSETGTMVYVPGPVLGMAGAIPRALVIMDRKGNVEPTKLAAGPMVGPRLSPDDSQVAVSMEDARGAEVWVLSLTGARPNHQLTFGGRNRYPVWSPDGQRIAFQSDRDGDLAIFSLNADGSGPVVRLTRPDAGVSHLPESWSRTPNLLSFSLVQPTGVTLWMLSMQDGQMSRFGKAESTSPFNSEISPDGQWVAYTQRSAAEATVVVEPNPPTDMRYTVGKDGGHHPLWSRDGSKLELSYRLFADQQVMVPIFTQPSFALGTVVRLPGSYTTIPYAQARNLDIMRAGRFLVAAPATQADLSAGLETREIRIVLNWFEELRKRVPSGAPK